MRYAQITGWGKCMPPARLSNDDLSSIMDTSDEWIKARTGISCRRIAHVETSDLAAVASRRALAAAGREPEDIDMVILATATPDTLIPSAASALQKELGAGNAGSFDLNAGCTGFVYGLSVASAMIRAGLQQRILLAGAERITWYLDWSLRDSAVLFGDGAGAAVIEPSEEPLGLLSAVLGCQAEARETLWIKDFGSAGDRTRPGYGHWEVNFDGREIFKRAVGGMARASAEALERAGLAAADVDLVIPHQANQRIIDSLAKQLGFDKSRVFVNIEEYGNTSAATVPVALTEALEAGRIEPGAILLMPVFGAGLTVGAAVVRWGDRIQALGHSEARLPPCDRTGLELLDDAIRFTQRSRESVG